MRKLGESVKIGLSTNVCGFLCFSTSNIEQNKKNSHNSNKQIVHMLMLYGTALECVCVCGGGGGGGG